MLCRFLCRFLGRACAGRAEWTPPLRQFVTELDELFSPRYGRFAPLEPLRRLLARGQGPVQVHGATVAP
jgi:hypothetical protein